MFVRSEAQDHVTDEYGGRFRRLYPWEGVASPPWGGAIMTIAPGDSSWLFQGSGVWCSE